MKSRAASRRPGVEILTAYVQFLYAHCSICSRQKMAQKRNLRRQSSGILVRRLRSLRDCLFNVPRPACQPLVRVPGTLERSWGCANQCRRSGCVLYGARYFFGATPAEWPNQPTRLSQTYSLNLLSSASRRLFNGKTLLSFRTELSAPGI